MTMLAAKRVEILDDGSMYLSDNTAQGLSGEYILLSNGRALIYVTLDWTISDLQIAWEAINTLGRAHGMVDKLGRTSLI